MNNKRFFALFLAAAMVLGLAAPTVSAAQDTVIVDDNAVIRGAGAVEVVEEDVTLTVKGKVGTITVTEDAEEVEIILHKGSLVQEIRVEGEDAEITVRKDAAVRNIVLNADAEIEGRGQVDNVLVNAEEAEIDVPNAKVTVGPNAEEVEAGDTQLKPGDVVVINPDGNGVKPWQPEIPEVPQAHLVEQARIVDLGWGRFVAVRFAEGHNLGNTDLAVDGVSINNYATPVTDDGSVIKWEVSAPGHAELVVTSGEETQTVSLGGAASAPVLTAEGTPDYFLLNGPVYVWDYHLTNYDDAGNIRVAPARTTMNLGVQPEKMAHYSPDAILHHNDAALPYFVEGEVQLMFNYAAGTEAEKSYVDGITDVDLVSFSEYHNTLNDNLTYTLDKAFPHGDHTVACIRVPIGQTNFTANGRYNLRVTSNGKADLYPIHVVEEVVPTMTVTGDTGYSGKEVHLRIADMTYGITRPIYRVDLRNPAGETFTLALFDDWFLFGDLLVLYNDKTNYFPVAGEYTVTCYADGFQTFSKTFHHDGFVSEAPLGAPVDIMTTATGGGSSSGGGGDAGDTKVMNANLIVDADLMANAKIVVNLGLTDPAAAGIARRWDDMSKLYVFNKGGETVYDAPAYFDAVNAAEANGQYLTFDAYVASGAAVTTPNRPYAVKQVLEDNLLGEATSFQEAVGAAAPALTLTAQTETSATFTGDEAYLAAIAELRLNNGLLKAGDYVIQGNTLTLNTVKIGENVLLVSANGYKNSEITFTVEKVLHEVVLNAADTQKGAEIVVTCGTEDFFKYIETVTLTAPNGKTDNVMPEGAESVFEKIGYTVNGTTLTIGKDTLNQAFAQNEDGTFAEGVYTVTITAKYYGEKTVTLTVTAPAAAVKAAPTVKAINYKTQFMGGNYYVVSFNGTEEEIAPFVEAINNISVNGQKVKAVASFYNDTLSYKTSNDPAFGGRDVFVDFTEDCFQGSADVVISADGYEDLSFTVVDGALQENKPVIQEAPTVAAVEHVSSITGNYDRLSFNGDVAAYLNAITSVTANGSEVKAVTNLFGETFAYKLSNDPAYGGDYKFLDFTADCLSAPEVTLVIQAEGYTDLTVQLVDGNLLKKVPGFQAFGFVKDMFRGDHYRLSFDIVDIATSATGGNGGGSVPPVIPPLPEPTPEMKELYNYVSSLKTYLNETKDSSITVNGVEIDESPNATLNDSNSYLVIADEHDMSRNAVVFNTDCFDNKKGAEIVIQVRGYEDLVLTVDGRTVEPPKPEPEVPQGDLAAPVVKDIVHKQSAFSGNSFVVKLADPENPVQDHTYNFLRCLTEVKVNGVEFTQSGSFGKLGDTNYTVNASSGEFVVSENGFGKGVGTFEVILTATGYQSLTFTVVDGKPAPASPALPAAPAVAELKFNSGFGGDSYTLRFEGDEAAVEAYLNAITGITVDGKVLTKVSSFFGDTLSYKISNDPAFGGAYCFLDLTADCVPGEMVIKAEGYQDLTYTLADPSVQEAPDPLPPETGVPAETYEADTGSIFE